MSASVTVVAGRKVWAVYTCPSCSADVPLTRSVAPVRRQTYGSSKCGQCSCRFAYGDVCCSLAYATLLSVGPLFPLLLFTAMGRGSEIMRLRCEVWLLFAVPYAFALALFAHWLYLRCALRRAAKSPVPPESFDAGVGEPLRWSGRDASGCTDSFSQR